MTPKPKPKSMNLSQENSGSPQAFRREGEHQLASQGRRSHRMHATAPALWFGSTDAQSPVFHQSSPSLGPSGPGSSRTQDVWSFWDLFKLILLSTAPARESQQPFLSFTPSSWEGSIPVLTTCLPLVPPSIPADFGPSWLAELPG